MADDLTETTLTSKLEFKGRMLEVRTDTVKLPTGASSTREFIVHPGAVVILPIFDNGDILLERQFRYPLGRTFIELPAGKNEPGEDTLTTGQRELLEETGYVAASWIKLITLHPCIGYSDEAIDLYLAKGLEFRGAQLDAEEFLETFRLPLDQALERVRIGEITEVKTVIGLFWAEKLKLGLWS